MSHVFKILWDSATKTRHIMKQIQNFGGYCPVETKWDIIRMNRFPRLYKARVIAVQASLALQETPEESYNIRNLGWVCRVQAMYKAQETSIVVAALARFFSHDHVHKWDIIIEKFYVAKVKKKGSFGRTMMPSE